MIKLTENQREILQAMLDGKDIELQNPLDNQWRSANNYDSVMYYIYNSYGVRIKPRTIIVNGVEVPEPMKVKPEYMGTYYTATQKPEVALCWLNSDDAIRELNCGLCHSTPEAATLHWEAMIKPSRVN